MAQTRLDWIATTPCAARGVVVPRILCKDGITLSVQASSQHSCGNFDGGVYDTPPWDKFEVACCQQFAFQTNWPSENNLFRKDFHDCTGFHSEGFEFPFLMKVLLDVIRAFIGRHGGEAEIQPTKILSPVCRSRVRKDYGNCRHCGAKLVPLDGGGGIYCPEGCRG